MYMETYIDIDIHKLESYPQNWITALLLYRAALHLLSQGDLQPLSQGFIQAAKIFQAVEERF